LHGRDVSIPDEGQLRRQAHSRARPGNGDQLRLDHRPRKNKCTPTNKTSHWRRLPERDYNDHRVDRSFATPQDWHGWLEANVSRYLLFARARSRGEADAQDLLQEVLVEVWRRAGGQPPDDALVFKTIRRRAIDLGRQTDRRRREEAAPDWWQPPEDEPTRDAALEEAVKTLPTHLREVVMLKIWSGLTFRQIADTLGLPPGTAASRYRYAIEHLRQALKEVDP
jgi:RNA polymerase sigma-70 factor (ECF subfamily)